MGFNPMFLVAPAAGLIIGWAVWSIQTSADVAASEKISVAVDALTKKIDELRAAISDLSASNRVLSSDTGRLETRVSRIETDLYHRAS